MKISSGKYTKITVLTIIIFQFGFPQYSQAYALASSGITGSVLAVANSPQQIIFDGNDIVELETLQLAGSRLPRKKIKVVLTAYSSTSDQTDASPFITANGSHVADGIVAANFLPFGTKLKIPQLFGDKIFSVEDRMNPRYYYKIDVWMPTREAAKKFGVKYAEVEVY